MIDDDEKSKKIQADLKQVCKDLSCHFKGFEDFDTVVKEREDSELAEIVLDVLRYADMMAYTRIEVDTVSFLNFAEQSLANGPTTLSWIDLILSYEWHM